jgi:hypothetical protein
VDVPPELFGCNLNFDGLRRSRRWRAALEPGGQSAGGEKDRVSSYHASNRQNRQERFEAGVPCSWLCPLAKANQSVEEEQTPRDRLDGHVAVHSNEHAIEIRCMCRSSNRHESTDHGMRSAFATRQANRTKPLTTNGATSASVSAPARVPSLSRFSVPSRQKEQLKSVT